MFVGVGIGFNAISRKYSVSGAASVGMPIPLADFETLEGVRVDLRQFQGHRLLVVFLDLECGVCLDQLDRLTDIFLGHGENLTGVVILPSNLGIQPAEMSHDYPFQIWIDSNSNTRKKFGNVRVPSFLFIDHFGILRHKFTGTLNRNMIDSLGLF